MKPVRWAFFCVLWMLSVAATVKAQGPIYAPPSPVAPRQFTPRPQEELVPATGVLSDWIVYRREGCEGQHGRYPPLYTEFYLSAGPSQPIGDTTLSRELQTGWSFRGGVRALFFNESHTRAWTVDGHIINTYESAGALNSQFPVTVFEKGVKIEYGKGALAGATLQGSNRTLAGLGFGRDWYLRQPANGDGWKWRVGLDAGGRYGSHRINLNEGGHLVDVIGAAYTGAHTDVEFDCRSCLIHAGLRFEYAYTWSDILQQPSDVQDLTLFLTLGIRY